MPPSPPSPKAVRWQRIVEACGRNHGANLLAPGLRIEQRFYDAYRRAVDKLSDEERRRAEEEGKRWWEGRAMRGPGVDW